MRNGFDGLFLQAFIEFISVWANEEVGSNVEIDFIKLYRYVSDEHFFLRHFDASKAGEEEAFELALKKVEDLVLTGFPVWEYLKVPEWTMAMLEKTFRAEAKAEWDAATKRYPCLTCGSFSQTHCSLGSIDECNNEELIELRRKKHHFDRWVFRYENIRRCSRWIPRKENENDGKNG
jgi:hypothetical protein